MGGWFREEIESRNQLKGKIIRVPGLGASVWSELGMKTTHDDFPQISIDEAIRRLKAGSFFAVEWTSPYDDIELGLHEAAKFYYYPGWWEPSTTFDVQVNIDAWKKLPDNYKEIFKLACHETYMSIMSDYDQKNSLALKTMSERGVNLVKFNDDILKAAKDKAKYVLDLYAQQDDNFRIVYDEWDNFKKRIRAWSDLNKLE
jgi:TRAP-type mannitol/chloroaromatic compound transport system substrate-binding protein